jgi:membrane protein
MTSANRHDARPDPDDERKPASPTDLRPPSWRFILKQTVREFMDDECTDIAAALTYYAVLSLFPTLLVLIALLGLTGQEQQTTQTMLDMVEELGPASAVDTFRGPIVELTRSRAAGFALVVGLVGAVWSASGYVGAFGRAMNRIYEIPEGRPFWKLRPLMIAITLVAVILIAIVAIGLVVTGPVAQSVGELIGLGDAAITAWQIAKWPVLLGLVAVIIAILYYATPNVQQPKFRWISIGALIAIITWAVASVLFAFYVANFSSYGKTYGSLAGVIIFLLWLWITNLALLFGAEFDAETERGRQLQAGLPAEESIQLPPRDTRKIEKREAKAQQAREEARGLREDAERPGVSPDDRRGTDG